MRCSVLAPCTWLVTVDGWQGSFVTSFGTGGVKPSNGSDWFVVCFWCVRGGGSSCVPIPRFFGELIDYCFRSQLDIGFGALPSHALTLIAFGTELAQKRTALCHRAPSILSVAEIEPLQNTL